MMKIKMKIKKDLMLLKEIEMLILNQLKKEKIKMKIIKKKNLILTLKEIQLQ